MVSLAAELCRRTRDAGLEFIIAGSFAHTLDDMDEGFTPCAVDLDCIFVYPDIYLLKDCFLISEETADFFSGNKAELGLDLLSVKKEMNRR
jgi:hypothetical protein